MLYCKRDTLLQNKEIFLRFSSVKNSVSFGLVSRHSLLRSSEFGDQNPGLVVAVTVQPAPGVVEVLVQLLEHVSSAPARQIERAGSDPHLLATPLEKEVREILAG